MSLDQMRLRAAGVSIELCPGPEMNHSAPQIKEEPEEQHFKVEEEQLPVSVPDVIAVAVKSEDEETLQTEHREDAQREDFSSETDAQSDSDTDNDDEWGSFSFSTAKSTGLFPKYKSVPEASASVQENDMTGAEGAEEVKRKKNHQCSYCQKKFQNNRNLQNHIRAHTGERPFSCTVCKKTFGRKEYIQSHMRTHTGERPFSCPTCTKTFNQRCHLRIHMRRHTGENLLSCSICHKTFPQNGRLQQHMKTHTGEKPFSCSHCQKSYAQKSSLDIHVRTYHTGERPFRCLLCNTSYADKYSLNRHMVYTRSHVGAIAAEKTRQNMVVLLVSPTDVTT